MSKVQDQIEEYLKYCEFTRRQSPMTLTGKRSTYKFLVIATKVKSLEEFDNQHFDAWIACMTKRGVAARTINTRMQHIIKMVKYFREMYGDKEANIPVKLPLIKKLKEAKPRRVAYSREQIEKALSLCDRTSWLLIKICFDSGLRISELRNLRVSNFTGRRINFIGKGSKDRESYIMQSTREKLDKYIEDRGVKDYLWLNNRGRPYSVDQIRLIMRAPFKRVGIDNFYPHALRHSFGTNMQRNGATLMEMQIMLGHNDAATTQRYLHGFDGKLGDVFDKYHDSNDSTPKMRDNKCNVIQPDTIEKVDQQMEMLNMLKQLMNEVHELKVSR